MQIGLPVWNCVVSTTPDGTTTLGQATEAILNDLGVIAEHFLVYLNANGALTYEQNVINDFVSLTDPLWPTGPRLNFSIDFSSVDHDLPLLKARLSTKTNMQNRTMLLQLSADFYLCLYRRSLDSLRHLLHRQLPLQQVDHCRPGTGSGLPSAICKIMN